MKRFLKSVAQWKSAACLMYTASIILYMAILLLLNAPPQLEVLFSLLIVSCLGTLIQLLAFTDCVFKRLSYFLRLLLFVCLFLPMITVCAVLFHWFPTENWEAWLFFVGIFLVFFLILTAGFEIYFRIAGQKYDGILGQYKKKRKTER